MKEKVDENTTFMRPKTKDIGVSNRFVPIRFVTIGWCPKTFINISFMVFSQLGFHVNFFAL
jgi:hypothetical protein